MSRPLEVALLCRSGKDLLRKQRQRKWKWRLETNQLAVRNCVASHARYLNICYVDVWVIHELLTCVAEVVGAKSRTQTAPNILTNTAARTKTWKDRATEGHYSGRMQKPRQ